MFLAGLVFCFILGSIFYAVLHLAYMVGGIWAQIGTFLVLMWLIWRFWFRTTLHYWRS